MQLRTVVWPVTALWDAGVLVCLLVVTVPFALWLAVQEMRDWQHRASYGRRSA